MFYRLLLEGDGKGGFQTIPQYKSGFKLTGDVRSVIEINDKLFFGLNGKNMITYEKNNRNQ